MNNKVVAAVAGLVIVPVIGCGVIYGWSELRLRALPNLELFTDPIPTDSASLAHGRHVAQTRGCLGCHGEQLQGHDFSEDWPGVGRPVASNLAKLAREHDASVLEAAIRQGVGHDGRALWSMPSYNFAHLTNSDLAALIAFLQSSPVVEVDLPSASLNLRSRWALVRGTELHMVDQVAALPPLTVSAAEEPQLARGEYLAMTTCNECHGLDLRGTFFPDWVTPDLAIVAAYPWQDFRTLMKEGVGLGGRRDLGLMTSVAVGRFSYFTEGELQDLYSFLKTLSGRPIATDVFWRMKPN